jgi:hypothetical protein
MANPSDRFSSVLVTATVPRTDGLINDPPIAVKTRKSMSRTGCCPGPYRPANISIPSDPMRKYPIARMVKAMENARRNPHLSASVPATIGKSHIMPPKTLEKPPAWVSEYPSTSRRYTMKTICWP